jgi:tetratricopeptide (TPR) repeat protein
MRLPVFILVLLQTACFTLATLLHPRAMSWESSRAQSQNLLDLVLGDARRLFANHFFVKADIYFHSGYYPSIFDQAQVEAKPHIAEAAGADQGTNAAPEEAHNYLRPPRDWLEKFGRNFFIAQHTELEDAKLQGEMLPWLKISAELDPQNVDTYVVTSFWLRRHIGKVKEAEQFLREGLRANPNSHEILYELGRLYHENYRDNTRARNLWQLAERKLEANKTLAQDDALLGRRQISLSLARLEEDAGNPGEALKHLRRLRDALPPEREAEKRELQSQIDSLTQKFAPPITTP